MFLKRMSCHGRTMGEVRSAQQKCVRRKLADGLRLLQLEHLLSEPDFSGAAMARLLVIASEDIGAASPWLVAELADLRAGWPALAHLERARRLLQSAELVLATQASRFVPHWAITLVTGVSATSSSWRSLEELLDALDEALRDKAWHEAGLLVEEVFLRHPLPGEDQLAKPVGLARGAMSAVWDRFVAHAPLSRQHCMMAWRRAFGPPSSESIASRLHLYMAVVDLCFEPPLIELEASHLEDEVVEGWLERAAREAFSIPAWMYDKHTSRGRARGQGQRQFLDEAVRLADPSEVLGAELEQEMAQRCRAIYLEQERCHGRRSRTAHIRERWRQEVA